LPLDLATNVSAAEIPPPIYPGQPARSHYLVLSDGRPYIPIGLNLIAPDVPRAGETNGLARMDEWMQQLAPTWQLHPHLAQLAVLGCRARAGGRYDEARAGALTRCWPWLAGTACA